MRVERRGGEIVFYKDGAEHAVLRGDEVVFPWLFHRERIDCGGDDCVEKARGLVESVPSVSEVEEYLRSNLYKLMNSIHLNIGPGLRLIIEGYLPFRSKFFVSVDTGDVMIPTGLIPVYKGISVWKAVVLSGTNTSYVVVYSPLRRDSVYSIPSVIREVRRIIELIDSFNSREVFTPRFIYSKKRVISMYGSYPGIEVVDIGDRIVVKKTVPIRSDVVEVVRNILFDPFVDIMIDIDRERTIITVTDRNEEGIRGYVDPEYVVSLINSVERLVREIIGKRVLSSRDTSTPGHR